MTREIKFRIWDKISKKMDFINWEKNILIDLEGNENQQNICQFWGDDGDFSLMQYTGLKDKTGKEIYEGDIVKYQWADEQDTVLLTINIGMGFMNGHYYSYMGVWFTDMENSQYEIASIKDSKFEVIGNVHENPELIDGVKLFTLH